MINITPEQFQQLCNGESIIISDTDGSTLTISSPVAIEEREKKERAARIHQLIQDMKEETESEEAVDNREVKWGTCPVITSEQFDSMREIAQKLYNQKIQNNSALYKDNTNGKD